jgi:aldehyde:ferredoxin oxidoreductase
MDIWRISLKGQSLTREPVPSTWERLGGRGLIARIMLDETPPQCAPLGPDNKLIFAPGLLVGHMLSSCDRLSIGGKSPLTGGIKESNSGGRTGLHMAHLGIKALILEGSTEEAGFWILHLSQDGAQFEPADKLSGKGVYPAARALVGRYGDKVAISLIGPGGEQMLSSAGIQNIDKDQEPSRINARGGLGAVMGSKGLKAIIFDISGCEKPAIVDETAYRKAQKSFNKALIEHPQTTVYADYGTAAMTQMSNGFGALPTRNFSEGTFEGVDKISGDYMRDVILDRGGEGNTTHACMAGCTIRCSNIYASRIGKKIVSPVEYETIGLLGSNLGFDDLDTIARLNWEINDLGLDTIEIGAALGVAADAGLFTFGDRDNALELLAEIRIGSPLGRILGHGAAITGKVLGVERIPAVKGQAISAYDPRAIKGTGVTYATSPQGADHTCGLTIRAKINHLDTKGQVALSRNSQVNTAGYDTLGACSFASFGFAVVPETIRDLLNARYGWDIPDTILRDLGRETLKLERHFNWLAGFTKADDRIPEWMTREKFPPHNAVFDVPDGELDAIFDW